MPESSQNRRSQDYLLLLLAAFALAGGGIITMGCDPKTTIPTGQLAPGQEDVRRSDRTGIDFRLDSTIEVALYELPTTVTYDGQEVEVTNWRAITGATGDSVDGNTARVVNTFTGQQAFRTAKFVGEFTIPGTMTQSDVSFHIRVGWFLGD